MEAVVEKPVLSNRQRRMKRQRVQRPAPSNDLKVVVRPQVMETRHLIEPENLRWFVLRVESGSEEALIRVMDLLGVPAAIPTVPRERRARGKLLRWRVPVAAGYVLIGFPGTSRIPWHEITRFRLVYSPLRYDNGIPVQVPWECSYFQGGKFRDGGVKTLLADFDAIRVGAAKYVRAFPTFEADEAVRVQDGPFEGHEGIIKEVLGSEAIVLLNILGRQTPANMPVEHIVRAA